MRGSAAAVLGSAALAGLLAAAAPSSARAETIYAAATNFYDGGTRLLRFDSASPSSLERSVAIDGFHGGLYEVSLEFDPGTHELYGFSYTTCQITCPPIPVVPVRIDPLTGISEEPDWPEFPRFEIWPEDFDIDPVTREIRLLGMPKRNLRFSLWTLELRRDISFDEAGRYLAVAHVSPVASGAGVETFAIVERTTAGLHLARIGGPGGSPPASSGQVHWIGPISVAGEVAGFDISDRGSAYLSTVRWEGYGAGGEHVSRLYAIDLATGVAQELGVIPTESPYEWITGIAVAPGGDGSDLLAIPSLSPVGLLLLAIALALAALRWPLRRARCGAQGLGE